MSPHSPSLKENSYDATREHNHHFKNLQHLLLSYLKPENQDLDQSNVLTVNGILVLMHQHLDPYTSKPTLSVRPFHASPHRMSSIYFAKVMAEWPEIMEWLQDLASELYEMDFGLNQFGNPDIVWDRSLDWEDRDYGQSTIDTAATEEGFICSIDNGTDSIHQTTRVRLTPDQRWDAQMTELERATIEMKAQWDIDKMEMVETLQEIEDREESIGERVKRLGLIAKKTVQENNAKVRADIAKAKQSANRCKEGSNSSGTDMTE
ncbi:MAG: hypothetical protein M1834_009169 [Cirrosporium novae-zelandiae]|nr:MAG: hypothetical protein M1834_009169 [Cirrosporium novae-zelandiae]